MVRSKVDPRPVNSTTNQEAVMTPIELVAAFFAVSNSARVLAYVPQIVRIVRDGEGARAVSWLTWVSFSVANFSSLLYAIIVVVDWHMAAVFAANTTCCLAIVGLTAGKRLRQHGAPSRTVTGAAMITGPAIAS
jgi:uncharacterized protein with PQ loop repeat